MSESSGSWTCNFASQSLGLGLGYLSLGLGLSQSHGLEVGRQSLALGRQSHGLEVGRQSLALGLDKFLSDMSRYTQ